MNLDEKIELILTRDLWLTKDFEQSKNEIKQLIKEAKNKQLLLHDVIQQRELLEWLSDEDYFNIPKDEINEILEDWKTYNSNCG